MNIKLEEKYSGDEAWYIFVEIAKKEINSPNFNTDYDTLD